MAKKKTKGELPSGNVRRLVYNGKKQKVDKNGNPIFDENGKPVMIRDYISVTESSAKDAERAKAEVIITKKGKKKPSNITIREGIDRYISAKENLLSPTTIAGYRTIQKYGFQAIMDVNIAQITKESLQAAMNAESQRLTKKGKKISPKTVLNEYGLIVPILKEYGSDIDTEVTRPQKVKKFRDLPDPDAIYKAIKGTDIELPVLLAMWLSFSMSEIRGLTKSKSISFDGNYIMIREVMLSVDGKSIKKEAAKEYTRNRKLRIPDHIKKLINEVEGDTIVPLTGGVIYKRFVYLIEAAGLPHMTFHDLRHVNASVMAKLAIPDKYAQERGGWASDKVMKSVYTETFSKDRAAVDDTIDNYFLKTLFNEDSNLIDEKYNAFKILFNLTDSYDTKKIYTELMAILETKSISEIVKMQHEMQHKKKNPNVYEVLSME